MIGYWGTRVRGYVFINKNVVATRKVVDGSFWRTTFIGLSIAVKPLVETSVNVREHRGTSVNTALFWEGPSSPDFAIQTKHAPVLRSGLAVSFSPVVHRINMILFHVGGEWPRLGFPT